MSDLGECRRDAGTKRMDGFSRKPECTSVSVSRLWERSRSHLDPETGSPSKLNHNMAVRQSLTDGLLRSPFRYINVRVTGADLDPVKFQTWTSTHKRHRWMNFNRMEKNQGHTPVPVWVQECSIFNCKTTVQCAKLCLDLKSQHKKGVFVAELRQRRPVLIVQENKTGTKH